MKTVHKYMLAAAAGSAVTLGVPQAFQLAARHYRDTSPARDFQMTVQDYYTARPGVPPLVVSTLGMQFTIEDNPARGITDAQAVAAQMKAGCTYSITAYGIRSRDYIRPNLVRARLMPTPQCPKL